MIGSTGIIDTSIREELINRISPNKTIFDSSSALTIGTLSLVTSVFFTLQVMIQTAIIILGGSIDKPVSQCKKAIILFECLGWFNVCIWANSTLLLSTIKVTDPIKNLVFAKDTWIAISRCVYPMMLFYRLHSKHELHEAGDNLFGEKPRGH